MNYFRAAALVSIHGTHGTPSQPQQGKASYDPSYQTTRQPPGLALGRPSKAPSDRAQIQPKMLKMQRFSLLIFNAFYIQPYGVLRLYQNYLPFNPCIPLSYTQLFYVWGVQPMCAFVSSYSPYSLWCPNSVVIIGDRTWSLQLIMATTKDFNWVHD